MGADDQGGQVDAAAGSAHSYRVTVDPALPPDGCWSIPTFSYDRAGVPAANGVAGWRVATSIGVTTPDHEWVASFAAGEGGHTAVHATPSGDHVCVVADGTAHLVALSAPERGAPVVLEPVDQVVRSADPAVLLLVGDRGLVAIGAAGMAWEAHEWPVLDDVRIRHVDATGIVCTGIDWDDSAVEFTVDPGTGRVVDPPPLPPWEAVSTAGARSRRWWWTRTRR